MRNAALPQKLSLNATICFKYKAISGTEAWFSHDFRAISMATSAFRLTVVKKPRRVRRGFAVLPYQRRQRQTVTSRP
jgi:hypothetical protein